MNAVEFVMNRIRKILYLLVCVQELQSSFMKIV